MIRTRWAVAGLVVGLMYLTGLVFLAMPLSPGLRPAGAIPDGVYLLAFEGAGLPVRLTDGSRAVRNRAVHRTSSSVAGRRVSPAPRRVARASVVWVGTLASVRSARGVSVALDTLA